MYVLHYRRKRSYSLFVVLFLLVGLGVGAYFSRDFFEPETVIGPTPAAVYSTVTDKTPQAKVYEEPNYLFELPSDWEKFTIPNGPAGTQNWRNTRENKGVRVITVSMDSMLNSYGVNRVLPVQISGDRFTISGDVSENCLNFTPKTGTVKDVPGKWQGADFMCDTENKVRNVVGVGADGAPTGMTLTGAQSGKRKIFITYIDSSANFNVSVLSEMVKSFKLK